LKREEHQSRNDAQEQNKKWLKDISSKLEQGLQAQFSL
jgi:hypothetical protein